MQYKVYKNIDDCKIFYKDIGLIKANFRYINMIYSIISFLPTLGTTITIINKFF